MPKEEVLPNRIGEAKDPRRRHAPSEENRDRTTAELVGSPDEQLNVMELGGRDLNPNRPESNRAATTRRYPILYGRYHADEEKTEETASTLVEATPVDENLTQVIEELRQQVEERDREIAARNEVAADDVVVQAESPREKSSSWWKEHKTRLKEDAQLRQCLLVGIVLMALVISIALAATLATGNTAVIAVSVTMCLIGGLVSLFAFYKWRLHKLDPVDRKGAQAHCRKCMVRSGLVLIFVGAAVSIACVVTLDLDRTAVVAVTVTACLVCAVIGLFIFYELRIRRLERQ